METGNEPVFSSPGQDQGDGPWAGPEGPGGYGGPGGYAGYGNYGSDGGYGDGRKSRPWRRHAWVAGASVGAAALVLAGLGMADATGATVLTTSQIASKVDPGLVDIVTTIGYQQAEAAGTGMVLTSNGEVLTNNHVIDGATSIKARDIGNGRTYTAKVVGYDNSHDVAVLQLVGASGLQTVSISSASPQAGQKVVALGNALGKGGTPAVATGKINGLGRSITASDEGSGTSEQLTGLIGHNAGIQPGDSGGPLVNTYGDVVGMDTAASTSASTYAQSGQAHAPTQAFAIPITEATSIASQIEAGTPSATAHLGSTAFLGLETSASGTGGYNGGRRLRQRRLRQRLRQRRLRQRLSHQQRRDHRGGCVRVSGRPGRPDRWRPGQLGRWPDRHLRPADQVGAGALPPWRQDHHWLDGPVRPVPDRHRGPQGRPCRLRTTGGPADAGAQGRRPGCVG